MALTLSTADDVLKNLYKDLREQINQNFFILQQIDKNTDDIEGRKAIHAVHVSRNAGVGARGDGGTLPTAGQQGYDNVNVPVRYNYGRIQLSGPVIAAMKSDQGSFIRAVKSEMDGVKNDLSRDVNRQIWGTSDGVIAATGLTTNSTTLNLAATTTPTQIRQLWADGGSKIDVGTVAAPTQQATGLTVTGYSASALTLTVSAAVTTTAAHRVFRTGAGGASTGTGNPNDGQYEYTGLQSIVDSTGALHTIDPASVPVWAATEDGNSGTNRALSENLINKNIHAVEIASQQRVEILCGSDGVSRAAANLMQSMRRNIDNVDLKGGYSGIRWDTPAEGMGRGGPIALIWDRDCPNYSLYGLSPKSLVHYVQEDWSWMDQDGAVLSRVSGQDAYEATLYRYAELACKQRNANFKLADITEA